MANMIPISTVTVGSSGTTSISFTSIPQIYTDLNIVYSLRTARTGITWDGITLSVNEGTTTPVNRLLYGTGSATGSTTNDGYHAGTASAADSTSGTFGSGSIYIPNYTGNTFKSWSVDAVSENNATAALSVLSATNWNSTAPINSLILRNEYLVNFLQYSSATLYGIRKY